MRSSARWWLLEHDGDGSAMGGKAAGLQRLRALKLNVPPELLIAPEPDDAAALQLATSIAQRLTTLIPSTTGWAVRSSSQGEDGAAQSMAGLFDTVVIGNASELPAAFAQVRASGARGGGAARMGVIVQAFIEPDYSGVVLSADPVSGESRPLIELVAGRGSRLVGGEADPWRYRGGVGWETACPAAELDAVMLQIVATAQRVAIDFGCEVDLEWALRAGDLFWLQARPMSGRAESFQIAPADAQALQGTWFLMEHSVAPVAPLVESLDPGGYFRLRDWNSRVVHRYHYIQLRRSPPPVLPASGQEVWDHWQRIERKHEPALRAGLTTDLERCSEAQLWSELEARIALNQAVVGDYLDIGFFALRGRSARALESMLAEASQHASEASDELTSLLGGLDTHTARKQRRLAELAQIAGRAPAATDLARWSDAIWTEALARFMHDYGFESANTTLYYLPTLAETPELVLALVSVLATQPTARAVPPADEWERAALAVRQRIAPSRQAEFDAALRTLRLCMLRTENDDYLVQRSTAQVRMALLEMGRRLHTRGALHEAADVFLLTGAELRQALVAGAAIDATTLARRRREFRHAQRLRAPSAITDGRAASAPQLETGAGALRGQPASAGVGQGVAIVVVNPTDRAALMRLPQGAVLVTRVLTPAMSHGLSAVCGIVTEVGGLTSHAAIVARELGIPAVIGVDRATEQIRSGALVSVNGNDGTIVRQ